MNGGTQPDWKGWPLYVQKRRALCDAEVSDFTKVKCNLPNKATVCAKDVVEWIYAVLTTLDSKASALMRLDGVLIAAAAFLLGVINSPKNSIYLSRSSFDAVLITGSAFLSAVSIGCCLFVVRVSWHFLGKVKVEDNTFDFSDELLKLDRESSRRQTLYRWAWKISLVATGGFLFEFLHQVTHVLSKLG